MKKLFTISFLIFAFLLTAPSVSAQNAHQKKVLQRAKQEAAQLTQKFNLNESQESYTQRYFYNYHLRMENRAHPTKYSKPLSEAEINKRLFHNMKNILKKEQLNKFKAMKDEVLKIGPRENKQTDNKK